MVLVSLHKKIMRLYKSVDIGASQSKFISLHTMQFQLSDQTQCNFSSVSYPFPFNCVRFRG
jgi:hypothetical protein